MTTFTRPVPSPAGSSFGVPRLAGANVGGTLLLNQFGRIVAGLALCTSLANGAYAQAAPSPDKPSASATQDPATLKVAREVVAQMQGDRVTTLNAMAAPMAGMMQQMGVREPERAQVIVREAVLPMLTAHYDELLDLQARSFATVLSKDDLQAVGAFYASPAGRRLAAAQPQLAQAQMTGTTQWMQALMPEMQTKIMQVIKAHGWGPGDKPK
ncbi:MULTISPECIES: DUF2059 domain-containing protein [unclassified Methylobacterium]|uniref:DUF2059 domain-containing protein n=1 Tax=unclassified Methylobacterium TaxID=2615210 RepID=UPI001FCD688A|nr:MULTISPECIES: DUF2059 domain-containing protein [unclassified Methylobacterium]USU33637.1 DUF2059 domain-containing protein [Methylobacterium sp. OTU13CASTA1]